MKQRQMVVPTTLPTFTAGGSGKQQPDHAYFQALAAFATELGMDPAKFKFRTQKSNGRSPAGSPGTIVRPVGVRAHAIDWSYHRAGMKADFRRSYIVWSEGTPLPTMEELQAAALRLNEREFPKDYPKADQGADEDHEEAKPGSSLMVTRGHIVEAMKKVSCIGLDCFIASDAVVDGVKELAPTGNTVSKKAVSRMLEQEASQQSPLWERYLTTYFWRLCSTEHLPIIGVADVEPARILLAQLHDEEETAIADLEGGVDEALLARLSHCDLILEAGGEVVALRNEAISFPDPLVPVNAVKHCFQLREIKSGPQDPGELSLITKAVMAAVTPHLLQAGKAGRALRYDDLFTYLPTGRGAGKISRGTWHKSLKTLHISGLLVKAGFDDSYIKWALPESVLQASAAAPSPASVPTTQTPVTAAPAPTTPSDPLAMLKAMKPWVDHLDAQEGQVAKLAKLQAAATTARSLHGELVSQLEALTARVAAKAEEVASASTAVTEQERSMTASAEPDPGSELGRAKRLYSMWIEMQNLLAETNSQ